MFGDFLSAYFSTFKLGFMSGIILLLLGIAGAQTLRLHWAQGDVEKIEKKLTACEARNDKLSIVIDTQASDIDELKQYYRNRKPMDVRDGELRPDETRW